MHAVAEALLGLAGGLALFLFGMTVMGDSLEKAAGNKLKTILSKMTANPMLGFLLGALVTAVIQSSSATTVMLVGFVNAGLINFTSAIPVIIGSNIGTTITAWILSLSGIDGAWYLELFKPSTFTPILAVAGVILFVFQKNPKLKDIGLILLGFSALIFGMDMMSEGFKTKEIQGVLGTFFEKFATNPLLGVLIGTVVTAIIQSSSASVGILQSVAIASAGIFTLDMAIPIIMGQNIGTCVTAIIGSAGANKDAKRVSAVHLLFNVIGTTVLLSAFCIFRYIINPDFVFPEATAFSISVVHTLFNLACTVMLLPFYKLLGKAAALIIKGGNEEKQNMFDDRLLQTPAIAIEQAKKVTHKMAKMANESVTLAIGLFDKYDKRAFEKVGEYEKKIDVYEDALGSYLLKITALDNTEEDNLEISKILHTISDFERISDHAVNIAATAKEMNEKNISFSKAAQQDRAVICRAIENILSLSADAFINNDIENAARVEPLEQVIDLLESEIRAKHIARLKNNECTIELGFILTDLLTDLERVADHCSNVAGCVIEIMHKSLGMHEYTKNIKSGNKMYDECLKSYSEEYKLSL